MSTASVASTSTAHLQAVAETSSANAGGNSVDLKGKGKQTGNEWWDSLAGKEPQYVVAPMVDQSELAWRVLSRLHGATLCYTPMFHAVLFSSPSHPSYTSEMFDTSPTSLEGVAPYDRPLFVQFCANDKDAFLEAAKKVVGRCDAVDLNLGCPQGIAKKGRYGAFLMDEWDTISGMVSHLAQNLSIPIVTKTRIFPTLDRTREYISHIMKAGSNLLTLHGRTRAAKGRDAGMASWSAIRAVREHLTEHGFNVPMFANGGVPSAEEVEACLEETATQGVMTAEGNLYNPMLFAPINAAGGRQYLSQLPSELQAAIRACDSELIGEWDKDKAAYAPATYLAAQYLAIVLNLPSTKTGTSAIKSHLFKLFRPIWAKERHLQVREMLGRSGGGKGREWRERVGDYVGVVDEMRRLLLADLAAGDLPADSFRPLTHQEVLSNYEGLIPYSHAQPYFRVADPNAPKPSELEATVEAPVEPTGVKRPANSPPLEADESSKKSKLVSAITDPVVAPALKPCAIGSLKAAPCGNTGAGRCAHGACQACCPSSEEGSIVKCEHHEERKKLQQERAEMKKQRARETRAARKDKRKGQNGGSVEETVLSENLKQGGAAENKSP